MELINRYIYAVTHRLPEQQREDIQRELRGLIEDMLEERQAGDRPTEVEVEQVLLELGPPTALADKYRGYERYLISPVLFDSYVSVLKIVLVSITIAMTAVFAIQAIMEPAGWASSIGHYFGSIFEIGVQGFAWVTAVFALIDYGRHRSGVKVGSAAWKPSDLPEIPEPQAQIRLVEPIVGILFTVIFTVIFISSVELIGVYSFQNGDRSIVPFLDKIAFEAYLPVVWLAAAIGIIKACFKMVIRKWNTTMLIVQLAASLGVFVLFCILFADGTIWNGQFMQQLAQTGMVVPGSDGYETVERIWTGLTENFLLVVGFFTVVEWVTEIYKWIRARR